MLEKSELNLQGVRPGFPLDLIFHPKIQEVFAALDYGVLDYCPPPYEPFPIQGLHEPGTHIACC